MSESRLESAIREQLAPVRAPAALWGAINHLAQPKRELSLRIPVWLVAGLIALLFGWITVRGEPVSVARCGSAEQSHTFCNVASHSRQALSLNGHHQNYAVAYSSPQNAHGSCGLCHV